MIGYIYTTRTLDKGSKYEDETTQYMLQSADQPEPSVAAASPWWQQTTAPTRPEGFSPFVAFCFTVNTIMGTGFLTIPWAFVQGGLVLSTVTIFFVGLFSDMAKNYLLETMARSEIMLDHGMQWTKRRTLPDVQEEEKTLLCYQDSTQKHHPKDTNDISLQDESKGLLSVASPLKHYATMDTVDDAHDIGDISDQNGPGEDYHREYFLPQPNTRDGAPNVQKVRRHGETSKYVVKHRKFEVNTMCRVFLGKTGLHVYTCFISMYVYCALWAFTSVFSSAMAKAAPVFAGGNLDTNYTIYAIIYACIVVPLSCMELNEQISVQVCMSIARFLMLGLMLTTGLLCAKETLESRGSTAAPLFRPSGIDKMLPVMVFAHIFHHGIPSLSQPVADKKKLRSIFQANCMFTTISYAFIGLLLGLAFGEQIEQSSNLNWKGFTGGTAVWNEASQTFVGVAGWAKAIEWFVLCFPALDVISAFPLNAIILGNNMMGAVYGAKIHQVEHHRLIRIEFRLLASVPPIVCGIFERQLGKITDYAGTTGFVMGFSFPALLYLQSRALAKKKHYSEETHYSSYCSKRVSAWFMFCFGVCMLLYDVYCLVIKGRLV